MFFLCCINRWGLQMCTWVKWPVCLPHSITVNFSNIFLNFRPENNKNLLRTSFELNLQSRKIFLGSPLVWVTPQTEPGDLLVFWRSSLQWMIVRWMQSPNSNSRCIFLLNPVNLNFFYGCPWMFFCEMIKKCHQHNCKLSWNISIYIPDGRGWPSWGWTRRHCQTCCSRLPGSCNSGIFTQPGGQKMKIGVDWRGFRFINILQ